MKTKEKFLSIIDSAIDVTASLRKEKIKKQNLYLGQFCHRNYIIICYISISLGNKP